MVQAYLYNKDTDSLQTIDLPNEDNKLSSILCERKMRIMCGYDNTEGKLKVFSRYDTKDHVNLVSVNNITMQKVLDYDMYVSKDGKTCYFVYLYITGDGRNCIALSYLAIDYEFNVVKNETIDNNIEFAGENDIKYKINFREPDDVIIEAYIIKNNSLYIYDISNESLTAALESNDDSSLYLIDVKTSKTDSVSYDEVIKVNEDIIPLMIVPNTNKLPYVVFINSKGDIISKFVFNTKFEDDEKIKKVLICESDTGGVAIEIYIGKYNQSNKFEVYIKRIKISTSDIYESIYRTSADFYIDDPNGENTFIAIRSKNIGFHSLYNKNLFFSKNIARNEFEVKDKFYSDSENIIKETNGADIPTIKNIIKNPYLKDVSGLVANDKIDKYDGLEYNDKYITQTISSTENGAIKLKGNGSTEVMSENTVNNMPISISGINTNDSDVEGNNNIIISNFGDIKVNEFTKLVMPYIALAFKKFVNVTLQDRELSLVFNRFYNYASIVEATRGSGIHSDFKNYRVDEIIEFLYSELKKKHPDSNVYKEQVISYIHEYFDINSHDIIDTINKVNNRISSVDSIDKISLTK